jgi:uncharacterized membrane protein YozB (DUF420 family)
MFTSHTTAGRFAWWTGMVLCGLVALVSMRYLLSVGPIPPVIFDNGFREPFLLIHVAAAAIALLVGPLQLLSQGRKSRPAWHRLSGRFYAVGCVVGGLSGFMLALGTSTGLSSTLGFGLLAIAWIYTTAQGWRYAVQRDFTRHRAWMIRSFALTCAAVTLRLYLPIIELLHLPFDDSYRAISFLCWVPNLLVAEAYLRRVGSSGKSSPQLAQ